MAKVTTTAIDYIITKLDSTMHYGIKEASI